MIKLKEIIVQLDDNNYSEIEKNLIKNKADRFLFLLQAYKQSNISDKEIIKKIGISSNSFYVLKSRLYDKIQDSLSCDLFIDKEKTIKLLLQIPELCLNAPRETATAYLLKIERDLLRFDMHNELLVVYSALKKIHLNSTKYHHYSQLYNKQVSYGLSLEKSEEFLGDFCRFLGQYDFSKSIELYEKLSFLRKEINNIYSFCNSKQIELIKNLMELQFLIFCEKGTPTESNINELLRTTRAIIDEFPLTLVQKKWEVVLDYICFEYYYSIGFSNEALHYYTKVNNELNTLLLYNHIGLVSKFLMTKIKFCSEFDKKDSISTVLDLDTILYDSYDTRIQITLRVYNALAYFYQKKYKNAIACLNDIQNEFVLKDYFHQFLEIKLTLLYFYLVAGELDQSQACIKMLSRRIKAENDLGYSHTKYLLKAFDFEITKGLTQKNILKQKDLYMLFLASNKGNKLEVFGHLIPELKRKYQI